MVLLSSMIGENRDGGMSNRTSRTISNTEFIGRLKIEYRITYHH